jgi:hypothetical protein
VDLYDYAAFESCMSGPGVASPAGGCACFDLDRSGAVDLADFALVQTMFTGG